MPLEETMATQHPNDEADIRHRIDKWGESVRAMDPEDVMTTYAPDIVSFDITAPLHFVGAEAKRKHWVDDVFGVYQRPLGFEIRNLTITVGDDVAFGHSLNRFSGRTKNGNKTDVWLRWTACFRKIDGKWLITHDHVSVPIDPASGKALMHLKP
jgi:uncharacterized protein (TIGR02246 family)